MSISSPNKNPVRVSDPSEKTGRTAGPRGSQHLVTTPGLLTCLLPELGHWPLAQFLELEALLFDPVAARTCNTSTGPHPCVPSLTVDFLLLLALALPGLLALTGSTCCFCLTSYTGPLLSPLFVPPCFFHQLPTTPRKLILQDQPCNPFLPLP